MSFIVGIFMSDSKNNDDNARYKEGYNEGRSGSFDPLLKVVEGLFFGGDQIKDAGRRAGRDDRHRYDGGTKQGSTSSSQHRSAASASKSNLSSGNSQGLPSGGLGHRGDTFGIVLGFLMLAGGIAYFAWVVVQMNNGGPESLGEFLLLLPGVLAILYVGIHIGVFLIGIALAIGVLVLIFKVVFG